MLYDQIVTKETGRNIWFLYNLVLAGLSVVTVYLGWVMVVGKESFFTLLESSIIHCFEKRAGQAAANDLAWMLSKPNRRKWLGIMNLVAGIGLFILAMIGLAFD